MGREVKSRRRKKTMRFAQLIDKIILGIQVFQNADKSCPERHGGENITRLYIDSSKPVPLGKGSRKKSTFFSGH